MNVMPISCAQHIKKTANFPRRGPEEQRFFLITFKIIKKLLLRFTPIESLLARFWFGANWQLGGREGAERRIGRRTKKQHTPTGSKSFREEGESLAYE